MDPAVLLVTAVAAVVVVLGYLSSLSLAANRTREEARRDAFVGERAKHYERRVEVRRRRKNRLHAILDRFAAPATAPETSQGSTPGVAPETSPVPLVLRGIPIPPPKPKAPKAPSMESVQIKVKDTPEIAAAVLKTLFLTQDED